MDDLLQSIGALYDPTRLKILAFLDRYGPACVCDLESAFQMAQPRLSRHLKILREAGYLCVNREGRRAYYDISQNLEEFGNAALNEIRTHITDLPEAHSEGVVHRCGVSR